LLQNFLKISTSKWVFAYASSGEYFHFKVVFNRLWLKIFLEFFEVCALSTSLLIARKNQTRPGAQLKTS